MKENPNIQRGDFSEYFSSLVEQNNMSTKILYLSAVMWSSFTSDDIAHILRRPERSVKIYLNRFVRKNILKFDERSNVFSFLSMAIKDEIYKLIPIEDKINLHERALKYFYNQEDVDANSVEIAYHSLILKLPKFELFAYRVVRTEIHKWRDLNADLLLNLIIPNKNNLYFYSLKSEFFKARGFFREACLYLKKGIQSAITLKDNKSLSYLLIGYFINLCYLKPTFPFYKIIKKGKFFSSLLMAENIEIRLFQVLAEKAYDRSAWKVAESYIQSINIKNPTFHRNDVSGELNAILGKIELNKGEIKSGTRKLIKSLLKKRKTYDKEIIFSGLLDLAWFHELNGDSNRAFHLLNWVLKTSETVIRPKIYLRALWLKTVILLDREDHNITELINEVSSLKCNDFEITKKVLVCYICAKSAARKGSWAELCSNLDEIFQRLPNFLFDVIRSAIVLIPSLPVDYLEKYINMLEKISSDLSHYWNGVYFDPLPYIIKERCSLKIEDSNNNSRIKSKKFLSMMENWNDPLTQAQFVILKLESGFDKLSLGQPYIEELFSLLNHPFYRDTLIDLYYEYGRNLQKFDQTDKGLNYLIKSRDLANRIKDDVRRIRSEIAIGSIIDISNLNKNFDLSMSNTLLLEHLIALGRSKGIDSFKENLHTVCFVLFGESSGELLEFNDDNVFKSCFHWGKSITISEQRYIYRMLRKLWRNVDYKRIDKKFIFLLITNMGPFHGALVIYNEKEKEKLDIDERYVELLKWIISFKIKGLETSKTTYTFESHTYNQNYKDDKYLKSIIGNSVAIQRLKSTVRKISNSPISVYLWGETGVGKELIAKAIHYCGCRKNKPFIAYNCSGTAEHLVDSDLFGHMKGSFTGAESKRKGLFLAANGGTIFLDEVADLPQITQVKLLRTLQERTIRPLGSDHEIPVDVRIISASNKDLYSKVEKGSFRKDLFFRLVVLQIDIPPLRDRREDIPILVDYFLKKYSNILNYPVNPITQDAMELLVNYDWPGNVRELQNVIEVIVNFVPPGSLIDKKDIYYRLNRTEKEFKSLAFVMEETERLYISKVLSYYKGNLTRAAKAMNISRQGLFKKVRRLGIMNEEDL